MAGSEKAEMEGISSNVSVSIFLIQGIYFKIPGKSKAIQDCNDGY